eukprot:931403-Pyramimonas_sp.AAC.1
MSNATVTIDDDNLGEDARQHQSDRMHIERARVRALGADLAQLRCQRSDLRVQPRDVLQAAREATSAQ